MSEYRCPKCHRKYTGAQFLSNRFCPDCGMYLRPQYLYDTSTQPSRRHSKPIQPQELTREQVNVHTLFQEFLRLTDFSCGEGIIYDDVPTWITERKQAYHEFQQKFRLKELNNCESLSTNFKSFLYFKNNKSWTTLYRSGMAALQHIEAVRRLLVFLQNDAIPIQERVRDGLGRYHVQGIGIAILTGLLHMFYPSQYGVWNSRSMDTLNIIKRTPQRSSHVGLYYCNINQEQLELAKELHTDLTTIDGFMWYISKRVQIIL